MAFPGIETLVRNMPMHIAGLIRIRARFKDDGAEFKTKAEAIMEGFRLLKNEYPDLFFTEGEICSRT